ESGPEDVARLLEIPLSNNLFPAFCSGRDIKIDKILFFLKPKQDSETFAIEVNEGSPLILKKNETEPNLSFSETFEPVTDITINKDNSATNISIKLYKYDELEEEASIVNEDEINDIFMVCQYKLV